MDKHTLEVLEFHKVKEHLRSFCASPLGRESVDEMHPYTSALFIRQELQEVDEMTRLWEKNQEPPLEGLYDVREPLQRSTVPGAILDPAEVILIRDTAVAARKIKSALKRIQGESRIRIYGERLIPLPELEEVVDRVFDEQSNLRDNATPEFALVRRNLRQQRSHIINRLERLMRGGWKDYLQETLYTQRDGRYVLPVDSRFQSKAKGIIHDRSSTGTTVYIEPMELVEDGNFLKDLHREEDIEINRILRQLTEAVSYHVESLRQNLEIFSRLDFIAAKARFSMRYGLNSPIIHEQGEIRIKDARHPLLLIQKGRDGVVPLDLEFPKDTRGVIITGPNTGGKTVVLKTAGLLSLMAQCGIPISAGPNSELPVFEYIGADIGDEQSLEQNLSTFSSHMHNIRVILERAKAKSLVLLDELGSGTDPIEGGALACSILQQLYRQGAAFLITTHLQELKVFAHNTAGIENGAMDFDLQNLQPTYKFSMGLPGKSNAIQIASRLGLPRAVVDRAQESLNQRVESPEDLLLKLGEELRIAREKREETESKYEKARRFHEEGQRRIDNAKKQSDEILRRAERKAQDMVEQFERRLKELERKELEFKKKWQEQLQFLLEQSRTANLETPSSLGELHAKLDQSKQALQSPEKPKPPVQRPQPRDKKVIEQRHWKWNQLKPGVRVKLLGMNEEGEVLSVNEKKNEIEVAVSSVSLRIGAQRIQSILQPAPKPQQKPLKTLVSVERPEKVHSSLDIHGMTVDEMTPLVQRYLDQAFLASMPEVRIVHGHGFGILRRAVRQMLKDNPLVREFGDGEDYEGGAGVTIAKLRKSI